MTTTISALHDSLNNGSAYQRMTAEKIAKMAADVTCEIASRSGQRVSLIDGNIQPLRNQERITYSCPLARKGKYNGFFNDVVCATTGDICYQNSDHGEYEMGVALQIQVQ